MRAGKGFAYDNRAGGFDQKSAQHFVKTGEIEAKFHRRLLDAQDNRIIGDYSPTSSLTETEAATIISQAEEFLVLAEQRLGALPPAAGQSETTDSTEQS